MIKSPNLDIRYFQSSIKNSIKSRWFPLLILFPLGVYGVYILLQPQLLSVVISLFPPEPDKSTGFYQDFLNLIFTEFLWLSAFLVVGWFFVVYVPLWRTIHQINLSVSGSKGLYISLIILSSFLGSIAVSFYSLELFPNSSDEYAYLYQARTLGNGKLWETAHPLAEFFYHNHIPSKEGITVSRFPPGWPIMLSTAYYFGFPPFLVNPILASVTLIVFYFFARRFYNEQIAFWSLLSLALTSFFMFNAASYFSHISSALFALSFVYTVYLYLERPHPGYAIAAGFCLGMLVLARYFTAVLLFLPFCIYIFYQLRFRAIPTFIWMGLGGLPCLVFLFWYNSSITGNPLLPVTVWAYANESLGFVRGHTVAKGFEHVVRWIFMFLYWCSPAILILYFAGMFNKLRRKQERITRPEDYFFLLLIAGYFFYYQIGGNQYGPRFLFEALPFVVLFVVSRLFAYRKNWALALFMAGSIYAIVKTPFIAARENRVIEERNDIYNTVVKDKINNAVVFVSSPTGVIRPMAKGDLTRNDLHFQNDVLFALDRGSRNDILMGYYPNRKFYKYIRNVNSVRGRLIRIK